MCEEPQKLLPAVPRLGDSSDFAGGDLQRGKQRRRAVRDVVAGAALGAARFHRQRLPRPIGCLDLGLLIHTQHDRVLRRCQIQANHVSDLRDQFRIRRERECLQPMRPDSMSTPRLSDRPVTHLQLRCQQPRRPMRHPQLFRRRPQRRSNNLRAIKEAGTTRTRRISQPVTTIAFIPGPLRHHRLTGHPHPHSNLRIGHTVDDRAHNPNRASSPSRRINAGAGG